MKIVFVKKIKDTIFKCSLKSNVNFVFVCLVLILVKLLFIPLTSHPFDFAAYVFQIRQIFDLGTDPFFYWNKGVALWSVFFSSYLSFDFLLKLSFLKNFPIELYHLVFKLPFFILDIFTGVLVSKIVLGLTHDIKKEKIAFLFWLCNPSVLWITEIHGQYAVSVSFLICLFIYLALKGKEILSTIPLAIAVSIYYFPVVLFPLVLFKLKKTNESLIVFYKQAFLAILCFSTCLILLFSPFIFDKDRGEWLMSSLLHHSQPDSPMNVQEVKIPVYSFFNFPYFIINNLEPSNLVDPLFYNLSIKLNFIFLFLSLIILMVVFTLNIKHGNLSINHQKFLTWSLLLMSAFMMFLGKFQGHYVLWILPLIIIYIIAFSKYKLLFSYAVLSFAPVIIAMSTQNLGIFFLDSLDWGTIDFTLKFHPKLISLMGFMTIVSLLFTFLMLIFYSKQNFVHHESLIKPEKILIPYAFISITLILIFSMPILIQAYGIFTKQKPHTVLASEDRILNYSLPLKFEKNIINDQSGVISDIQLVNVKANTKELIGNGHINFGQNHRLYFYNVPNSNATDQNKVYIQPEIDGLNLELNSYSKIEISYGSSGSSYLLPLKLKQNYQIMYRIAGNIDDSNLLINAGARYGDLEKKIIAPNQDEVKKYTDINGDSVYLVNLYSADASHKYFEPVLSFEYTGNKKDTKKIKVKSIQVIEKKTYNESLYTMFNPENVEVIRKNIIGNENANQFYFIYISNNLTKSKKELIYKMSLNNCILSFDSNFPEYDFPLSCFNFDGKNSVNIYSKNLDVEKINFQASIIHDLIPRAEIF